MARMITGLITPVSAVMLTQLLAPSTFKMLMATIVIVDFTRVFASTKFRGCLVRRGFSSGRDLCGSAAITF